MLPPQSTSVSWPFLTLSKHEAPVAWQMPPPQDPLEQSALARQPLPSAQVGQVPPPQSTSVSLPFFWLSMHEG
jgi:hypothetical protein